MRQETAVKRCRATSTKPRIVTQAHLDDLHARLTAGDSPDVIAHRATAAALKLSTPWFFELLRRLDASGNEDTAMVSEWSWVVIANLPLVQ